MVVMDQAKRVSREWVIRQMLKLLPRLSMENMETMISLGQKLLRNPEYIEAGEAMKDYIRQGHPTVKVVDKVLHDLSPEVRIGIDTDRVTDVLQPLFVSTGVDVKRSVRQ